MPLKITCKANDEEKHENDVNNMIFHKGKLYSAGDDGMVKAWTDDLKKTAQVHAHPCSVYCLTGSNETIYSCSNEGTIKAWQLKNLKEDKYIFKDESYEIWNIKWADGVLYAGDDQGNVRVFKEDKFYGIINVAEPVKDMTLFNKNILFSVKDNDVVVTELHLKGITIQFGSKQTVQGRAPLIVLGNKVIFTSRGGRDLLVYETSEKGILKLLSETKDAHDLIINALNGCSWDGKETVFSGGWDKILKQWQIDESGRLILEGYCNVEIVINCITVCEKRQILVGGDGGHIIRIDL